MIVSTALLSALVLVPPVTRPSPPAGPHVAAQVASLRRLSIEPFAVAVGSGGWLEEIRGARIPIDAPPDDRTARALDLLRPAFGLPAAYEPVDEHDGAGGRIRRVRFLVDGKPVVGASLLLVFDEDGALTGARAEGAFPEAQAEGASLSQGVLEHEALRAVRRERRGLGVSIAGFVVQDAQAVWVARAGSLVPARRIHVSAVPPGERYRVLLDARDGSVLRVEPLHSSGKGLYPWFGNFVSFPTGKAKGNVFPSVPHALAGFAKKKKLKNWALGVPNPVGIAKGILVGAHIDVWDDNGNDPFSPAGSFLFDPYGVDPDPFDATQLYFEVESFWKFLKKTVPAYAAATGFSIPALVNVKAASMNAFFSPTPFPVDQHVSGHFQFLDVQALAQNADADSARELALVDHEYTHAVVWFAGPYFLDVLDSPTRAVGEAVADFAAVTHHDDTALGRLLDQVFPGQGFLRDLQDGDVFPDTTIDAMGLTSSGLPEEHRNGEIVGSLLVDLREQVGAAKAMDLVFRALQFMPPDLASIGYQTYTAQNALAATSDYFGRVAFALLDADTKGKHLEEILGAATGRGVLGSPAGVWVAVVNLEVRKDRRLSVESRFTGGLTAHRYAFSAKQGRKLTVKILGAKSGTVLPDFTITDDQGNPAAVTHTQTKTFEKNGRLVVEKGIVLDLPIGKTPNPGDPFYVVEVTTPTGSAGEYRIVLDA